MDAGEAGEGLTDVVEAGRRAYAKSGTGVSFFTDSDDEFYDGNPEMPAVVPDAFKSTPRPGSPQAQAAELKKALAELANARSEIASLKAKLTKVSAKWSARQRAERMTSAVERARLVRQLQTMVGVVELSEESFAEEGSAMLTAAGSIARENNELREANAKEAAEARSLRDALARVEAEAEESRSSSSAEVRSEAEAARHWRHEHEELHDLLHTQRTQSRQLEIARDRLQTELDATQIAHQDSLQRRAEGAAAIARMQEVEAQMRMESEAAESRRAMALMRAEVATQQALMLCKGLGGSQGARPVGSTWALRKRFPVPSTVEANGNSADYESALDRSETLAQALAQAGHRLERMYVKLKDVPEGSGAASELSESLAQAVTQAGTRLERCRVTLKGISAARASAYAFDNA